LIFIGVKKKRKKEGDLSSADDAPYSGERVAGKNRGEKIPVCSGCMRSLKVGAVYDQGKTWCPECYKTHVLRIKA